MNRFFIYRSNSVLRWVLIQPPQPFFLPVHLLTKTRDGCINFAVRYALWGRMTLEMRQTKLINPRVVTVADRLCSARTSRGGYVAPRTAGMHVRDSSPFPTAEIKRIRILLRTVIFISSVCIPSVESAFTMIGQSFQQKLQGKLKRMQI